MAPDLLGAVACHQAYYDRAAYRHEYGIPTKRRLAERYVVEAEFAEIAEICDQFDQPEHEHADDRGADGGKGGNAHDDQDATVGREVAKAANEREGRTTWRRQVRGKFFH
jgi:hypothetical protein